MDIEDMGYSGTKVVKKNDQEPAIVELQRKSRGGTFVRDRHPKTGKSENRNQTEKWRMPSSAFKNSCGC